MGMDEKNYIQVDICGRNFKLSGYDSEEYLRQLAAYLTRINMEYEKTPGYKNLPFDQRGILVQLNIADDYFKAIKKAEDCKAELETKSNELYDIKHELVTEQMKKEAALEQIKELQEKIKELENPIVKK